jgi:hypothetical protein
VNTWKVIIAILVIFGSGLVTGGLLVSQVQRLPGSGDPSVATSNGPSGPAPWQAHRMEFLRRIERHLEITPEQRGRIEAILRESHERTKPIWDGIGPQLQEELMRVRQEIREELTPEQRQQFDEMMERPPHRRRPYDGPPRRPRPGEDG